jgi:hypothetical protein
MNDELGQDLEGSGRGLIDERSRNLNEGIKVIYGKPQLE